MSDEQISEAFDYAKAVSPFYVANKRTTKGDVKFGFYGQLGITAINRVLSFQGSLFRELGIYSKFVNVEDGCFEVTYSLGGTDDCEHLRAVIDNGSFDSLAYRYSVLFIRFLDCEELDEVHFTRDSLYR